MKEKLENILKNNLPSFIGDEAPLVWKDEFQVFLEDYRRRQILQKLTSMPESHFLQRWKKLHLSRRSFLTLLFYMAPASYFFLSGLGFSGWTHFLGTISLFSLSGLTLFLITKSQPIVSRIRELLFLRTRREFLFQKAVEPEELIGFWKEKARVHLDEREAQFRNFASDLDTSISESNQTKKELLRSGDARLEPTIQRLEQHSNKLKSLKENYTKSSEAIALLRDKLQAKMTRLQAALDEFNDLESRREHLSSLLKRASEILGESETFSTDWTTHRGELQDELKSLTGFLQEELLLSRDYLVTQLEFERGEIESTSSK